MSYVPSIHLSNHLSSLPGCALTHEPAPGSSFFWKCAAPCMHACICHAIATFILYSLLIALGVVVHWCIHVFRRRKRGGSKGWRGKQAYVKTMESDGWNAAGGADTEY